MEKDINYSTLLDLFLDFGEAMLTCGGEVNRTEDSISRMGRAYGATKTNVFVITSSIVLTMTFPKTGEITQTRRILSVTGTDFQKLEKLNTLSRRVSENPVSAEILKTELKEISKPKISALKQYLGSMLAAGGFAVFFGGNLWDAAVSALLGAFICLLQIKGSRLFPNKVFYYFFSSLATGLLICFSAMVFPVLNIDKIMIGDIMLLIPGVATTTAARDMLIGDTISGMQRLTESIIWAVALAGGFMVSITLTGGIG